LHLADALFQKTDELICIFKFFIRFTLLTLEALHLIGLTGIGNK
jgi:hypothetical protein